MSPTRFIRNSKRQRSNLFLFHCNYDIRRFTLLTFGSHDGKEHRKIETRFGFGSQWFMTFSCRISRASDTLTQRIVTSVDNSIIVINGEHSQSVRDQYKPANLFECRQWALKQGKSFEYESFLWSHHYQNDELLNFHGIIVPVRMIYFMVRGGTFRCCEVSQIAQCTHLLHDGQKCANHLIENGVIVFLDRLPKQKTIVKQTKSEL